MLRKSLPVAPSMEPVLTNFQIPKQPASFGFRTVYMAALSILTGIMAGFIARLLTGLIGTITNLCFYGKFSTDFSSPANNNLGLFVIFVPVIGAVIVGFMAKYGSTGIRGHGIPEAMEQVILNESRIPPRLTFLKPISAAFSIGTGGPFGAEGPIIATGGAFGSLIGQLLHTSASERKTLLAAGAAAGMAATFGTPVSSVLLAVELLLFEFKPQSLIPVTLASTAATAVRFYFLGTEPIFRLTNIMPPDSTAMFFYLIMGALVGLAAVFVTRSVYKIEDAFDRLPIHWMWWPAIGALAVGIIGYFVPKTMGVGYDNIENILAGSITGKTLIILFVFKFISWSISLGSGTSGGTLAPLFTIGGGLGALLGSLGIFLFPDVGIDVRLAALVGMAAMFAGSARALLTSIIFAFETTMQPVGLLPLLAGCSAAYLVSSLLMKHTIMTEKIARRGIKIPFEYEADFLDLVRVKDCATYNVITINGDNTVEKVKEWLSTGSVGSFHHEYPVIDSKNNLIGSLSRKEILQPGIKDNLKISEIINKQISVVFPDNTLKEALDLMAETDSTRLPVVERSNHIHLVGILSRSDILKERRNHLKKKHEYKRSLNFRRFSKRKH
ncbi:MAG TPA: chloride channel protein [Ignavibacteriaceae bacterium]|nr:chloride channel protein [Ignavibacteriaceae bacterium]